MTKDAQAALQTAVYAALIADATIKSLVGNPARVYDHVPQGATFPYVVLGEGTAIDFDTVTTDGMEQTLTIHTWSRYRGMKEAKDIMAAIVDVLDNAALSVTGHTLVNLRFEFSQTLDDPDGLTRHGVQRFRAVTQEV